jgi:hypothetical protein
VQSRNGKVLRSIESRGQPTPSLIWPDAQKGPASGKSRFFKKSILSGSTVKGAVKGDVVSRVKIALGIIL